MKKTVISFGELLWDLLPNATILGGAPFNFAYRVNCLGDTGLMISRLGKDRLGERAFNKVVELGLKTTLLQWDGLHATGTVDVRFDEFRNPDYVIVADVAYDFIKMTGALKKAAQTADCLCFGTLAQRTIKSRETLSEIINRCSDSALLFLDINLRKLCYSFETITFSLEKAHVLKLNEDEAKQLAEMFDLPQDSLPNFCHAIVDKWDLDYCIVTLAEKGAFSQSRNGDKIYVPGIKVHLKDSLGAGDAFSAGFIHKILRGESMAAACRFGNILGAMVATQEGATTPISIQAINSFQSNDFDLIVEEKLGKFMSY